MREIPLTKGYVALVDDEDYERVAQFKWAASKSGSRMYAKRVEYLSGARRNTVYMHRFILNASRGDDVDHRNHKTLDNRRCELRIASVSQNGGNQRLRTQPKTSKFKGVVRHKRSRKWQADITVDGNHRYLGSFATEEEAACAYDAAARLCFGDFALTNFQQA